MNPYRIGLIIAACAFAAFIIASDFLIVQYEDRKSDERITQSIAAENAKMQSWFLSQQDKPHSFNQHSHCYLSGTGAWPEEATTSDCVLDVRANPSP